MIGSLDYTKVKDPDVVVFGLLKQFPGRVEDHFGVEPRHDPEEVLEAIAKKKHLLRKGNEPDIERAARMILKMWQQGDIQ